MLKEECRVRQSRPHELELNEGAEIPARVENLIA